MGRFGPVYFEDVWRSLSRIHKQQRSQRMGQFACWGLQKAWALLRPNPINQGQGTYGCQKCAFNVPLDSRQPVMMSCCTGSGIPQRAFSQERHSQTKLLVGGLRQYVGGLSQSLALKYPEQLMTAYDRLNNCAFSIFLASCEVWEDWRFGFNHGDLGKK